MRTRHAYLIALTAALTISLARAAPAAGVAYVQSASGSADPAATSSSVAFPSATTTGNLLVVAVSFDSTNSTGWTCSDTLGNTYVAVLNVNDTRHAQALGVCYSVNRTGGADSVTVTFPAPAAYRMVAIHEYSGVDAAAPLDKAASNVGTATTATDSVTSTSIVPAHAGDLFFGVVVEDGDSTTTASAGTGFALRQSQAARLFSEDQIDPSTTAAAATFTFAAAGDYVAQLVAFSAAGTQTSDTMPPTVPANLSATAVSPSEIDLAWTASTDNVGVAGYHVYRNGAVVATSSSTSYRDTRLTAQTTYTYAVDAFDAAGNTSAQSATASATTLQATSSGPAYPLKASANERYLVDQNNVPFLLSGDSPQSLIGNLTQSDADAYLADRKAHGFNAVWVNLLCASYTGCNADGTTYDGIPPFTTPGDLSTPNEAYFARADAMIALAAKYGLVVVLDPAETGSWLSVLENNGATKARAYGQYVGNRYRNVDNIIWMSGNDFQTWQDTAADAVVQAVALGIKDVDTRHIHTIELNYFVSGSLDDSRWAPPVIGLDAAYTYYPTYAQVLTEYNRSSVPVFLVEANYEFEHDFQDDGNPLTLRRQEYWTMLSGAAGQMYGNHYTWTFTAGWQSNLDTPGAIQFDYMKALFESRAWYDLVPDQNHSLLTAGYGTFSTTDSITNNDYATAAMTGDRTLAMAYLPTQRTVTINMASLAGAVAAHWYDPTNGTYAAIAGSPFANSGARQFTSPGANSTGDGDWVLVLEASGAPDTQPPSTPTNLVASALTASSVTISWSPSTDNVGVAGYRVYRNGASVGTVASTTFNDAGLSASTNYSYTVAAYDTSGNVSPQSQALAITTPAASSAPPAFVQVNANKIASGTRVDVTFPLSTSAGNVIVVYLIWDNTAPAVVSDSHGNAYSSAAARTTWNGTWSAQVFYARNATGGADTVSATFQTAITSFGLVYAHEYAGLDAASPVDTLSTTTGVSGSLNGAVTTLSPNDLIFVGAACDNTITGATSGFTVRSNADGNLTEDRAAVTSGSYPVSLPQNGNAWVLQIVALRSATP